MTSRFLGPALGGALLLLMLPVAGCDTAATGEARVETLVDDARIAREAGRLDEAERLLERAYAEAPASAVVRVELGQTYFQRGGVGLLDVDRLARFLTDATGTAAPAPETAPLATPFKLGATCPYASDPTATPFDPREMAGYPDLLANRAVVREVLALMHEASPGGRAVMPAALRALSLCEGIEDGQLVYDREGALAALRAQGLTTDQIASALALNAVGRLLESYFVLTQDLPQQTAWYRVNDGATATIGVCAEDPEALRTQADAAIADFGEALTSLDLRAQALGGQGASVELVRRTIDAYERIRGELGPVCGG